MKHHTIQARPHCKAIRYVGLSKPKGGQTSVRGDLCASQENVENGLCWLHRKVVEIRGVDVEKVLRGER